MDQLVAYIVPDGAVELSNSALRHALAELLPPYMVPGRYEMQEAMPRLTSGKIDRKALKAMPLSAAPAGSAGRIRPAGDAGRSGAVRRAGRAVPRPADTAPRRFLHRPWRPLLLRRAPGLGPARRSALRPRHRARHLSAAPGRQDRRRAGRLARRRQRPPKRTWTPPSALRRWTCGLAQAAAMPALVALRMAQWLAPFFTYHFYTGDPGDSVALAIARVGRRVPAGDRDGILRRHRRQMADRRTPASGQLSAVGPDLLSLVAGRPPGRSRAVVFVKRLLAVRVVAARARRQDRP